jgi:hypothetical protein
MNLINIILNRWQDPGAEKLQNPASHNISTFVAIVLNTLL